MYIDIDTIIKIANLITALGVIVGLILAIYKIYERDRKQAEINKAQQEELLIICQGLKGVLQGFIEAGGDGPCKEALSKLETHLNDKAHSSE
jgi:beta-lactamase regulating signal transducer with metallopeptidase domain